MTLTSCKARRWLTRAHESTWYQASSYLSCLQYDRPMSLLLDVLCLVWVWPVKRRRVLRLQGRLRKSTTAWLRLEYRTRPLDRYTVPKIIRRKGANWRYHLLYGTIMMYQNSKVVSSERNQRFRKVIACSQCPAIDRRRGAEEGANNVNEPVAIAGGTQHTDKKGTTVHPSGQSVREGSQKAS